MYWTAGGDRERLGDFMHRLFLFYLLMTKPMSFSSKRDEIEIRLSLPMGKFDQDKLFWDLCVRADGSKWCASKSV